MVTATQLALPQSPISSLIPSVGNNVTVKLDDTNYVTWNFQMELLLSGHGILGFVDVSTPCPDQFTGADANHTISDAYQVWKIHDKALMILLIATLPSSAISYAIGSHTSREIWLNLKERFASVSRTSIFQMKTNIQNIKIGPESIDHYLQKIKDSRDQLSAAGVDISDEDITILTLKGLLVEYNIIKVVIHGRESILSMKELRSQLKAEESTLEESARQIPLLSAMSATPPVSGSMPHSGMPSAPYSSVSMQPVQYASPPSSGFRGNNFRDNGKGRMSSNNFQRFFGKSGHYNNSTGILGKP
ncbi:unnamed protein product [Prunus armeniaca]|uniref:Uncharacterized protein n=1 Tax=Prunus armeniaca TaxID=36596 RepID=A0A6J5VWM0_PRUAR|nr:unnamed protein product [Prunus armeniaca]